MEIIPYEEAEKLLGLNVKENHNLLNESSNNINELISICNKEKLTLLNNTINNFITEKNQYYLNTQQEMNQNIKINNKPNSNNNSNS